MIRIGKRVHRELLRSTRIVGPSTEDERRASLPFRQVLLPKAKGVVIACGSVDEGSNSALIGWTFTAIGRDLFFLGRLTVRRSRQRLARNAGSFCANPASPPRRPDRGASF